MIVINKQPNITHMPYTVKGRKVRSVFSFRPGQNEIGSDVWAAIKKQAGEKRWAAHYGNFLKPINEGAAEKESVDFATLSADDAIDLAEGAMTLELLAEYQAAEEGRKAGARKTVIAAIEKQIEAIKAIDDAKEAAK